CLNLLNVNLSTFCHFDAPLSKVAEKYIFWGVICFSLIGDIPQLVIQRPILRYNSISYNDNGKNIKPRNISNELSNIQHDNNINITIDLVEEYGTDEPGDILSEKTKSLNNDIVGNRNKLKERRTKSWNHLINNTKEDHVIIKENEKEKRVSVIENKDIFAEEKGIIVSLGNTNNIENNAVKDNNTYTSIMVEGNTNYLPELINPIDTNFILFNQTKKLTLSNALDRKSDIHNP
ncbi:9613_t:CDS:2, partial [Scutellospora calospora]